MKNSTFQEITYFDGETEIMVHQTGKSFSSAYVYVRDTADLPKSWKFRPGLNPLFVHIAKPSPRAVVAWCERNGFQTCDD